MSQSQKNAARRRKGPKRVTEGDDTAVVPFRAPDSLESTLPPTPLRDLLAADGASICVFTETASLLATVQEASGEQYPVLPVSSWQALCDAVSERRCGIALLDSDAISGALTDRLAELARLNPALVLLIASTRERADVLLDLLTQRKIHRLLIKPPTVGITRLLLESSVNRYIELRQRPDLVTAARHAPTLGFAGWSSWLLAGGLVVGLLVTVALTSYMNRPEPASVSLRSPVSELPASGALAPTTNGAVTVAPAMLPAPAGTLPAAHVSVLSGGAVSSTSPAASGTDAAALGNASGELEAAAQADRVELELDLEARYGAAEAALIADDVDAAVVLLEELASLDPDSSRVAFLRAQLDRRQEAAAEAATAAAAAALAAESAAARSELTSLVGLARARLARQQLDAPAGDSALDYLDRARAVEPAAAEVQLLAADLGAALLTAAEIKLADGEFVAAESLLTQAQALGVSDEDLVALELSLTYARETLARAAQAALLAQVDERLADGRVFVPADSALAAVVEVQRVNPDHPDLPAALAALEQALQAAVQRALAAADWDGAEAAIAALSRAGAALTTLDPLRAALAFGRRQEAYLATPAPAGELAVLQFEPPVYPSRALRSGAEGWVDLQFVIDRSGRPREIVVTAAEPAGEFEPAARAAAETYVFVPFELDGRLYERRVNLRMRFALQ